MTWWLIVILVIYFGFNLFCAIWLSKTSRRGGKRFVNNFEDFMYVFIFGGLAGIAQLIVRGIIGVTEFLQFRRRIGITRKKK